MTDTEMLDIVERRQLVIMPMKDGGWCVVHGPSRIVIGQPTPRLRDALRLACALPEFVSDSGNLGGFV